MCLSFGEYPVFATKVDAWLACSKVMFMGRPRSLSHSDSCGNASENTGAAIGILSDTVIDLDVEDCLLHVHASGKKEFGPALARNPPEVDFVLSSSPQKSASV